MRLKHLSCLAVLCACTFSAAAFAEQVDNPAYTGWAKYKPGTSVTIRQTMDMPGMGVMQQTDTVTLVEVAADKVVVETKGNMVMAGQATDIPATKSSIPAKVDKADELTSSLDAHGGSKPVVKDVKAGKDTVTIGDKKLDTVTQEFTVESKPEEKEKATGTMKTWSSAEVPGGLVKAEMTMTLPMAIKMNKTVIEYSVK